RRRQRAAARPDLPLLPRHARHAALLRTGMDFSLSDEQRALTDLGAQILKDLSPLERLKAIEQSEAGWDRELWAELAKAGLLAASLPEAYGGSGGGFLELCLLLEQQGRRAATVPLLATLAGAALPLVRFGTSTQKDRWLPDVAAGKTILSAALTELGAEPRAPITVATADGGGFRLSGVKSGVPMAHEAAAVVVPARTSKGGPV